MQFDPDAFLSGEQTASPEPVAANAVPEKKDTSSFDPDAFLAPPAPAPVAQPVAPLADPPQPALEQRAGQVLAETQQPVQAPKEATTLGALKQLPGTIADKRIVPETVKAVGRGLYGLKGLPGEAVTIAADTAENLRSNVVRAWRDPAGLPGKIQIKLRELRGVETPEPKNEILATPKNKLHLISQAGRDYAATYEELKNEGILAPDPEVFAGTFTENPSIARLLGSTAESLPAMALGVGGKTKIMRRAAGALMAATESLPEYRKMIDSGMAQSDALANTMTQAVGTYYLEKIGLEGVALNNPLVRKITSKAGAEWLVGSAIAFASEGSTEGLQTIYQNALAMGYDGDRKAFDGLMESILGGGIMGGGMNLTQSAASGIEGAFGKDVIGDQVLEQPTVEDRAAEILNQDEAAAAEGVTLERDAFGNPIQQQEELPTFGPTEEAAVIPDEPVGVIEEAQAIEAPVDEALVPDEPVAQEEVVPDQPIEPDQPVLEQAPPQEQAIDRPAEEAAPTGEEIVVDEVAQTESKDAPRTKPEEKVVEKQVAGSEKEAQPTAVPKQKERVPVEVAKTQEEASPPVEQTGIKQAAVDVQRKDRGLPPLETVDRQTNPEQYDEAVSRIEKNPDEAVDIISDIKRSPRTITPVENFILLQHETDLRLKYNEASADVTKAFDEGRTEDVDRLTAIRERFSDDLVDNEEAAKLAGTEWGRAGQARQRMMSRDFSLAAMETRLRAAKGGEKLTTKERSSLEAISEEYKSKNIDLQKKVKEAEEKASSGALDESFKQILKDAGIVDKESIPSRYVLSRSERVVTFLDKRADAARVRLKEKMSRVSSGIDPTMLVDLAEIGASHIAHTGVDFAAWSKRMTSEFGDLVKPHLRAIFDSSKKIVDDEVDTALKGKTGAKVRKKIKSTVKKESSADAVDTAVEKITEKVNAGKESEISVQVQKLAKAFVAESIQTKSEMTMENLVDRVHETLSEIIPGLTKRQTMDAISGYGKFSTLSKEEVSVELRDLKGQMQQVAKLEDMQAGKAPSKTGVERREPSSKERKLIKQVNEAKRKGGFDVTDPEAQLKTALDGVKTRLSNRIADLERQIKTREKDVSTKTKLKLDDAGQALKKRADDLKKEYDELFGEKKLTDDEKRTAAAIKAVENSIKDIKRRIGAGDLFPGKKPSKTKVTPELTAARAERDAMKEELKLLQKLARPPKTREQVSNQAFRTRTANRIADLERRIAEEDFIREKKAPLKLDEESLAARAALESVQERFTEKELDFKLRNRPFAIKVAGKMAEGMHLSRAIMTSFDFSAVGRQGGFIAASHPIRAAKSLKPMFDAFKSKESAGLEVEKLKAREKYAQYKKSGLFLSIGGAKLSQMEEAYMSRHASKIPGVGASERAYTTFLNKLRADSFDAMTAGLAKRGAVTEVEAKAIATFINEATGRGKIGISEDAAVGLNTVFFAPRLVASRLNMLTLRPLIQATGGTARSRALVAGEYARYIASLGVIYSLAELARGEDDEPVEWDPRSSQFGKINIGDTRIDPLSGLSQVMTFASRIATGETKGGDKVVRPVVGKGVGYADQDLTDIGKRFLRSKLSPAFGAAINLRTGENVIGEKVTPKDVSREAVTPLVVGEILDAMKAHGVPRATALSMLAIFGIGVQTYDRGDTKAPVVPKSYKLNTKGMTDGEIRQAVAEKRAEINVKRSGLNDTLDEFLDSETPKTSSELRRFLIDTTKEFNERQRLWNRARSAKPGQFKGSYKGSSTPPTPKTPKVRVPR